MPSTARLNRVFMIWLRYPQDSYKGRQWEDHFKGLNGEVEAFVASSMNEDFIASMESVASHAADCRCFNCSEGF